MPGEQAFVQEGRVAGREVLEVVATWVLGDVVRDRLHPGPRDRVVVLCGARSYAAICRIQAQIVPIASGMPYRRTA